MPCIKPLAAIGDFVPSDAFSSQERAVLTSSEPSATVALCGSTLRVGMDVELQ